MRPLGFSVVCLFVVPVVSRAADRTPVGEPPAGSPKPPPVDYRKDVKPILQERCYACHGALQQKGKLRVDSGAAMLKREVVVPGKPDESELIARVTSKDDGTRMPPEGHPLKPEQIAKLRAWIEQGAKVPTDDTPEPDPRDHWAFRTPTRPTVPVNRDPKGSANPIDAFVAAKWAEKGLKPVGPADKRLLVRRVYLDLTGLPPTAEETEAFLKDAGPDAYEKVVDRLLASPRYGERWGRHFLDIWRYSDWWGLGAELRNSQKHIWHWRDWTVESLNADVGYDEMVRQMLAADELYPLDARKLRATGFLARPYFLFNRTTWLDEVIEHTGKGVLGLTFNCAKCHDHKYDPVTQADYYRFRAIFEPYQLRTDLMPGEPDPEKAGIPRAFDCNLDVRTFLHVRGDERNPDKDRKIEPGLPGFLLPDGLKVTPVKLPAFAHQPGLRPDIIDGYRRLAQEKHAAARAALIRAKEAAEAAAKVAPKEPGSPKPAAEGKVLAKDDFGKPNPELWEVGPGMWKHDRGRLLQQKPDGDRSSIRAKLAPPADFEARFAFVVTGGEPYRSVGVSFDVTADTEALVYVSAAAAGPKLQVSFKQNGNHAYPADGMLAMPIPVGKPIELTVRVRGQLVNVAVNGDHALAYKLPVPRKDGKLELITYTATAEFTAFELRELPKEKSLVEPGGKAAVALANAAEVAKAELAVAEKAVAAAKAELDSVTARADAMRSPDKAAAKPAAKAEKDAAVAAAELAVAQAELELLKSVAAQKPAVQKKVEAAKVALAAAKKAAENPGETYTPLKGAVKTKESNVEGADSLNKPFPDTSTGRRSALARWATDRTNPLTARVAVNHAWMRHFGQPLVPTIFEFGRRGTPPTHPELLDWLAVEFMEKGWSLKHLHKLIVTSNVYRLTSSSLNADESAKLDPENRFLWRQNPQRMEAQVVRDGLLHLAGELDLTAGGPPVPLPEQENSRRRALYFFHSHNDHNKFLDIFDDANVLECYRRTESIVPQQGLALWNSKFAMTMAGKINDRLHARLGTVEDAAFVKAAFETVLGTSPTPAEEKTCLEALAGLRAALKDVPDPDRTRRARFQLVQALVNHNDFVTVR